MCRFMMLRSKVSPIVLNVFIILSVLKYTIAYNLEIIVLNFFALRKFREIGEIDRTIP